MVKVKKPAHEPFLFALEMMKAHAGETVLTGDTPHRDIEPCRALGIRTVYARYVGSVLAGSECHRCGFRY